MITVTEIRKTCGACPAQWEGTTEDGQSIYIRFRWGYLRVSVGPTIDDAVQSPHPIFQWGSPDGLYGWMEYEELKQLVAGKIILPDTETI